MNIRSDHPTCAGATKSRQRLEAGFHLSHITDFFCGALPGVGLFAHTENMESLVSYPKGDAVWVCKGRASVETCQDGFRANLFGSVAVAGAGILSGVGLAAAAMPVAGLGVAALAVSGATNAFTRQEIRSASR